MILMVEQSCVCKLTEKWRKFLIGAYLIWQIGLKWIPLKFWVSDMSVLSIQQNKKLKESLLDTNIIPSLSCGWHSWYIHTHLLCKRNLLNRTERLYSFRSSNLHFSLQDIIFWVTILMILELKDEFPSMILKPFLKYTT